MINAFLMHDTTISLEAINSTVKHNESITLPKDVLLKMEKFSTELKLEEKFYSFVEMKSEQDDTWFFWSQYVFHDCCAYMNLFLSIRTSNWYLRQSSLKLMVPLYSACDSTTYQKLIPHHIADIVNTYPDHVRNCLQSGAFTVSITGRPGHSVALDKSHEMCINKDF